MADKLPTSEWPLMDEEILVVKNGNRVTVNLPRIFYARYVKPKIGMLSPLRLTTVSGQDDQRIVIELENEKAEEFLIWLSICVSELGKYFITLLEDELA